MPYVFSSMHKTQAYVIDVLRRAKCYIVFIFLRDYVTSKICIRKVHSFALQNNTVIISTSVYKSILDRCNGCFHFSIVEKYSMAALDFFTQVILSRNVTTTLIICFV